MGFLGFGKNGHQKAKEILKDYFWIEADMSEIETLGALNNTDNPWAIAAVMVNGRDVENYTPIDRYKKGLKWIIALEMMQNQRLADQYYIDYLTETIAFQLELDPDMSIKDMKREVSGIVERNTAWK